MARAVGRIAWGISVTDERISDDGRSLILTLRMSRWRIAWEMFRAIASMRPVWRRTS